MKKILLSATLLITAIGQITTMAQSISIRPLPIFGDASTIYPFVSDSTLYFASNRKNDIAITYLDNNDNHLYQLYKVQLFQKKPKGQPETVFSKSNNPTNQISICFDPKTKETYVSQNQNYEKGEEDEAKYSIFKYDDYEQPERLKVAPMSCNAINPAFSPDGKTFYFASDKPDGFGSTDLYYCEIKEGQWSKPQNMGAKVNTSKSEIAPFVHPSGKIFFASNGRKDSRKLDIYYTFKTASGFAEPKRFDAIVNSIGDDYGIFISDNEEWGYITSNRYGKDQLFFFQQTFPTFPDGDEIVEENYCYTFFEETAATYDTTEFSFKWDFGDGDTALGLEVDHCFKGAGEYEVSLTVLDKVSGEELYTIANYSMSLERPRQITINAPKKITVGKAATFTADTHLIDNFVSKDFYWDFGNGNRFKGKNVSFTFDKPGKYIVKCGTISEEDPTIKICNWTEIEVTM